MKIFKLNIIGLGNVGQTLARLFVQNGLATIVGVYNRDQARALSGIAFIGQGEYYDDVTQLPHADITLITTSDSMIASMSQQYSLNKNLQPGDIILHCSGVLASDSISILRAKGCHVCSVHPMHSFINPSISLHKYPGTYCAFEGDDKAADVVIKLFAQIGSIIFKVIKELGNIEQDVEEYTDGKIICIITTNINIFILNTKLKC